MSHKNKKSLVRQVQEAYDNMLAIGQSKHQDKIRGDTFGKIYSWNTYKSYMKHANYFTRYCRDIHGCRTLEECRLYVDEWLQHRIDNRLSAYTIKLESAALGKLYGCRTTEFIKTPSRKRENIQRSRGDKVRDYHFSESDEVHPVFSPSTLHLPDIFPGCLDPIWTDDRSHPPAVPELTEHSLPDSGSSAVPLLPDPDGSPGDLLKS